MADRTAKASEILGAYGPGDPLAEMGVVIQDNPDEPITQAEPTKSDETQIISSENLTEYLNGGQPKQPGDTPSATEQQQGQEVQPVELTPETMVKDYRDGVVKPFKEIEGSTVLKAKYDQDLYQLRQREEKLAQASQYVQNNLPYLEAIEKSNFASVLATNLVKGIPQDQAIASAMAAIGLSSNGSAPADADPEPTEPDADPSSPEYAKYFVDHTKWEARKDARKATAEAQAPLLKELQSFREKEAQKIAAEQQAQTEAVKINDHNKQMLPYLYNELPFKIDTLTADQVKDFNTRIDRAASDLQIDGKRDYLRMSDVVAIATRAFAGKNPYAAPATQAQALATASDRPQIQNKKAPLQPGVNGMGSSVHLSPSHDWSSPESSVLAALEEMASGGR